MEAKLPSSVHFLNRTFHLIGPILTGSRQLDYERSAHNEFRVWLGFYLLVDVLSKFCEVFVTDFTNAALKCGVSGSPTKIGPKPLWKVTIILCLKPYAGAVSGWDNHEESNGPPLTLE